MYKHNFHPSILREYDIRGIINKTLYEKDAFMIGYFFGLICKEKILKDETNIVISMDGRLSSPDLKEQTKLYYWDLEKDYPQLLILLIMMEKIKLLYMK